MPRDLKCVMFVSSGMVNPKKGNNPLMLRHQYLNYGALSLATSLSAREYSCVLIHAGFTEPSVFLSELIENHKLAVYDRIMLSIPSFFSLSWAAEFSFLLKKYNHKIKIIAGGRWVIGGDLQWVKGRLPNIDCLIPGFCDSDIESVVNDSYSGMSKFDKLPDFNLDHRLVHNYLSYNPSIEVSRGCGMGCGFCEDGNNKATALKKTSVLCSNIDALIMQYGTADINLYFQSANFNPSMRWAELFYKEYMSHGLNVNWRCQTRVDKLNPAVIAVLAEAGLKVIDLGLESASIQQLLFMGKADDPAKYLRRASGLIEECKKNNVWVKVNHLIYAGETHSTIDETMQWLDHHSTAIKGISSGPVIVFGSPSTARDFISDIKEKGADLVDDNELSLTGIAHIHPSKDMSNHDARNVSREFSRRFMSKGDYFDLKSFSYFPRDYLMSDYDSDITKCDTEELPFHV